jgi:hypothetical protein
MEGRIIYQVGRHPADYAWINYLNEGMENKNFNEWLEEKEPELIPLTESTSRYSVEVNYRTKMEEVVDNYAKLCLGYVSAGLKNCGFHVKNLYDQKPYRILVSTRNWDDGEWVGILLFNTDKKIFVVGKGHYNKDRKTVSVQGSHKSTNDSASELCKEMRNYMEKLKKEKPRGSNTLEPAPMKRGPKPKFLQKIKGIDGPWKGYNPY